MPSVEEQRGGIIRAQPSLEVAPLNPGYEFRALLRILLCVRQNWLHNLRDSEQNENVRPLVQ